MPPLVFPRRSRHAKLYVPTVCHGSCSQEEVTHNKQVPTLHMARSCASIVSLCLASCPRASSVAVCRAPVHRSRASSVAVRIARVPRSCPSVLPVHRSCPCIVHAHARACARASFVAVLVLVPVHCPWPSVVAVHRARASFLPERRARACGRASCPCLVPCIVHGRASWPCIVHGRASRPCIVRGRA